MPLLRYRPCLPYTLQRYVSDVWLSLCFLLISLSSSPFLLWPHPRNIRGCVLIYDFSLCTHPLTPLYLPLPIRPSPQLALPHSPLLRLTPPPTYFPPTSPTYLAFNSSLRQLIPLPCAYVLTCPPTYLSSSPTYPLSTYPTLQLFSSSIHLFPSTHLLFNSSLL